MRRWAPAALLALACLTGAFWVPGLLRARRVQADFEALLAGRPDVAVESLRTLSPAELGSLDPTGRSSAGTELIVRFDPPEPEAFVVFRDALQARFRPAFPEILSRTSGSTAPGPDGRYRTTLLKATFTLLSPDTRLTLRSP